MTSTGVSLLYKVTDATLHYPGRIILHGPRVFDVFACLCAEQTAAAQQYGFRKNVISPIIP